MGFLGSANKQEEVEENDDGVVYEDGYVPLLLQDDVEPTRTEVEVRSVPEGGSPGGWTWTVAATTTSRSWARRGPAANAPRWMDSRGHVRLRPADCCPEDGGRTPLMRLRSSIIAAADW